MRWDYHAAARRCCPPQPPTVCQLSTEGPPTLLLVENAAESDVAGVVQQIELSLTRFGADEIVIIERAAIGRDERWIGHPVGVLKQRRLGRQETP
jgi:hypothetical protein